MDLQTKQTLEGNKIDDNLEATSASVPPVQEVEERVELNNTPQPEPEPELTSDEPVGIENAEPEQTEIENEIPGVKTYTQEDLNELAGRTRMETREKTFRYIYDRYGVQDEAGLDDLVGNAQRYDSLQEKYDADKADWKNQSAQRDKELADIKEQVALMQSGIDADRYDDAKLILRGKGLEVSLDNINQALSTHPEWKKEIQQQQQEERPFVKVDNQRPLDENPEPVSKISVLGNESQAPKTSPQEDEETRAMRLFKV